MEGGLELRGVLFRSAGLAILQWHLVRRGVEQVPLQDGEASHAVGGLPPAQIGLAGQHAEPRAWHVEQHPVGDGQGRQISRVGLDCTYDRGAQAPTVLLEQPQATGGPVDGASARKYS